MGMFDYVNCQYTLPQPSDNTGGYIPENQYQTKCLENCLFDYEIRTDGTLWVNRKEYEIEEGDANGKSILDRISRTKITKDWYEPVILNKTIRIYNYIQNNDKPHDYSIDYEIRFDNGKISQVYLSKFEACCNENRKLLEDANKKELREWYEYSNTKRYKYIVKPWSTLMKRTFRATHRIINSIKSVLFFFERKITR